MKPQRLAYMAASLVGRGKGLLAIDESIGTCNRRFASVGIDQTVENRRAYRELLITTPSLGESISGAILCDETLRQRDQHGTLLMSRLQDAGIVPGIKVDLGTVALALHPGDKITEGLDGLSVRLKEYAKLGAGFAKWRAVLRIAEGAPSDASIVANAQALARYAAMCQEAGLVPIVEPEVLMDGNHTLKRCSEVTHAVLNFVFAALRIQGVAMDGMILKPNMVLTGADNPLQPTLEETTAATLECLMACVPADVAGVAFLSGGQSDQEASIRLNALNITTSDQGRCTPWPLVFSYGRALQRRALAAWNADAANVPRAQRELLLRARCNHAALTGRYTAAMEPLTSAVAA